MAQHDYIISNATFPAVRTDINNALSAIQTTNSGTSRPTGAVAGQIWLDTTNATSPTLKFYDGADDISLATINYTANTVDWLDSSITITGLSTTATGTVLTLSDTANTTSQNLIIDNQKEIRFRETTANGTNYVALKAPASVSADLTFTLPATDGTNGQALITNGSGVLSFTTLSADGTADWDTSVKTTGFTATANKGYFCNTTSAGFTVTLPASPTAGDEIIIIDYAGTFDTNALVISPNGKKIESTTDNLALTGEREGVRLVYIDSTQGWLAYSGINEGTDALSPAPYSVEYLVVAGGGGGGNDVGGGGGAGGLLSNTFNATTGTSYTITIGAGGAGSSAGAPATGVNGSNSSISGTGLTTITSTGGGGGGSYGGGTGATGATGGSGGGGGGGGSTGGGAGTGTSGQGNNGGAGIGNGSAGAGGGGGGASATGTAASGSTTAGNGGNGSSAYSTWGSATSTGQNSGGTYYYAGGGAGCNDAGGSGTAGLGGGGKHQDSTSNSNGTANTGGGAGGGGLSPNSGGNGGSGIIILRYSGSQRGTGGTVVSSGGYTYHTFTSTSSYTG